MLIVLETEIWGEEWELLIRQWCTNPKLHTLSHLLNQKGLLMLWVPYWFDTRTIVMSFKMREISVHIQHRNSDTRWIMRVVGYTIIALVSSQTAKTIYTLDQYRMLLLMTLYYLFDSLSQALKWDKIGVHTHPRSKCMRGTVRAVHHARLSWALKWAKFGIHCNTRSRDMMVHLELLIRQNT